jgi:hypothetical protein
MRNKVVITFETFWEKYPLHKAKKDAERAWNRLSAKDQRAAYNAIDSYCESCRKTGVAFKYAQGWLNGRRWEDEDDGPVPQQPPQQEAPESMEIW